MSATTGFSSFASLAAVQLPGATPAPIRRNLIINQTASGIENYSGPAAGLGVVLDAGITGMFGTTTTMPTITNTWNTDTTLALLSGAVRFTNNHTANTVSFGAYVISTL